ncbi:MAG: cytochrome c-type biogenesis protein CcmH [Solirubrobacterales bacterium]
MTRLAALGALAATLLALALPAAAAAAETNASLPDIEDEVMCTICGTTLQLSNSPQAERERVFINELIAQGKTKEQIKAALVDEYGPEVLAVPDDSGFDLIGGWVLPVVGVIAGAVLVALAARRWRRDQRREDAQAAPPAGPDPASDEAKRLREDLERYGS